MTRPNILLIHADQHRFDCVGINGHPMVKTPNIDRLAAEGMNFTQAYTPIPVCIPARNSLMHGQWPSQHLSIANWDTEAPRPAKAGLPAFSQMLKDAGYHLAAIGKWQVHPNLGPLDYGFDTYIDDNYDAWRASQGIPPRHNPISGSARAILTSSRRIHDWAGKRDASSSNWSVRQSPNSPSSSVGIRKSHICPTSCRNPTSRCIHRRTSHHGPAIPIH